MTRLVPSKADPYSPWGSMMITCAFGKLPLVIDFKIAATVFDFPLPVEPRIAQCRVTSLSRSSVALRLSDAECVPIRIGEEPEGA